MRITEINIKLREEPKLKAFVNITFENVFSVKGLKIIQSKKGLLLCMPSRKVEDGTQRDIAHPISKEFRDQMEREILAEYYRVLKQKELEPHEDNRIEEEFAFFEE
ncbi:MAG: SpoVG family protein [candidate division KSB1 bacterium]|nr:SpoVG family protein [candidate division KSB1 bacterium]